MGLPATQTARWAAFHELSLDDLYELLRLRQNVFILEQASFYADIDGKDQAALHYLMREGETGSLLGAIRLFAEPENLSARIGRVVIAKEGRGFGLGRLMMQAGIDKAEAMVPGCTIHLSAQSYLEAFYRSLGFESVSEEYIEDGIPHVDMIRSAKPI
jgi:ElaA protein